MKPNTKTIYVRMIIIMDATGAALGVVVESPSMCATMMTLDAFLQWPNCNCDLIYLFRFFTISFGSVY